MRLLCKLFGHDWFLILEDEKKNKKVLCKSCGAENKDIEFYDIGKLVDDRTRKICREVLEEYVEELRGKEDE